MPENHPRSIPDTDVFGQALDTTGSSSPVRDLALGQGRRFGDEHVEVTVFGPPANVVRVTLPTAEILLKHDLATHPARLEPGGLVLEGDGHLLSVNAKGELLFQAEAAAAPQAVSEQRSDAPPPTEPGAGTAKERPARRRVEGNVAHPPVFRVTSRQRREVAVFVVAEHYTDETGGRHTVYHRCAAFNKPGKMLADKVRDEASQGDRIVVHGNWHDVPIEYRDGTKKTQRQLWAFGVKITSKEAATGPPGASGPPPTT